MSQQKISGLSICLSFMSPALAYGLPPLQNISYEVGAIVSRDTGDLGLKQNATIDNRTLSSNTDLNLNLPHHYKPGIFGGINYQQSEEWSMSAKLSGHLNNSKLYSLRTVDSSGDYDFTDRISGGSIYTLGLGVNKAFRDSFTFGLGPMIGYREYEVQRTGYSGSSILVGPNSVSNYKLGVGVEAAIKYNITQNWFINLSYSHMKFGTAKASLPTNGESAAIGTGYIDIEPDVELLTIGIGVDFG